MMSGDDSSGSSSDSDDFVDASQGPPTSFTSSGSGLSSQGGNIVVDHSVVDTSPMMNAASQPLEKKPSPSLPLPPHDPDLDTDSPLPPRAPTPTNSGSEDSDVESVTSEFADGTSKPSRLSLEEVMGSSTKKVKDDTDLGGGVMESPEPRSPAGSVSSTEKYKMIDKDTGKVFDIRDLDEVIDSTQYSLIPTKEEIIRRKEEGEGADSDGEGSAAGARKKSVKGFLKGFKNAITSEKTSEPIHSNSVPVKSSKKDVSEFGDLVQLTSIPPSVAHSGPIWVMKFSKDGRYLATGGGDKLVKVWEVRRKPPSASESEKSKKKKNKIPTNQPPVDKYHQSHPQGYAEQISLFSGPPIRTYSDHTADVISLSWSRTTFLLSASLDKTVRLWHISRSECLHLFQHSDFVTSVDFHPIEDRYFLSGGFDKKLRIWSIPDGRVKEWSQAPEMVTAARFTPNGLMVVAGLYHGQVYFYSTEGMRYYTQVDAKNRHGSQSGGKKVTGLEFLRGGGGSDRSSYLSSRSSRDSNSSSASTNSNFGRSSSESSSGLSSRTSALFLEQLLITTNDSRLRLVGMDDYSQLMKYKGLTNWSMQISASFSESGQHIIAGSEDGKVYIWNTQKQENSKIMLGGKKDRNKSTESFTATSAQPPIVTEALFCPTKTVKHSFLSASVLDGGSNFDCGEDLSSAMVVTGDYDGGIRVYLRAKVYEELVEVNKIDLGKGKGQGVPNVARVGEVGGGLGWGGDTAF
ncbi:hypothetical protein TrST_g13695 [Triparma strigata]|uniref:WD40 repeat-like protein n=1 Tax=Triparma strigata TaxID=1606541 RepID=A0A9W7BUD0_9STRA|nr:hypothetical protein TrST_g13695 [Triparma strigata]